MFEESKRWAKNLYYSNSIKRKIKLLDERVRRAHQRFTVNVFYPNYTFLQMLTIIDYECRAYLSQDAQITRREFSFLHFNRRGMINPSTSD